VGEIMNQPELHRVNRIWAFVAIVLGYSLSVTLATSFAAVLTFEWNDLVALLTTGRGDLILVVGIIAGIHFIAGDLYFLMRSRIFIRWPVWTRTIATAGAAGCLGWCGFLTMIAGLVALSGQQSSWDLEDVAWLLPGPLCFAAGVLAGELIVRLPDKTDGV
jgi:hypothetical protein